MDFDEAFDRLFSRTASDNEDERRIAPFWLGAIGLLIFVLQDCRKDGADRRGEQERGSLNSNSGSLCQFK